MLTLPSYELYAPSLGSLSKFLNNKPAELANDSQATS